MIRFPVRSKVAAVIVLFFLGTFAGQFGRVLDTVSGNVEAGKDISERIRSTVSTIQRVDTSALEAQIAALQLKLSAGAATPGQVDELRRLVAKLKAVQGPAGTPGPQGAPGATGPPGPAAAPAATTTTSGPGPGGTSTTTRPATTTTTRAPTTTTTRCAVRLAGLCV